MPIRTDCLAKAEGRVMGNVPDNSRVFHHLRAEPGYSVRGIHFTLPLKGPDHFQKMAGG